MEVLKGHHQLKSNHPSLPTLLKGVINHLQHLSQTTLGLHLHQPSLTSSTSMVARFSILLAIP
jgi:hypothetical protein